MSIVHFITFDVDFKIPVKFEDTSVYLKINNELINIVEDETNGLKLMLVCHYKTPSSPHSENIWTKKYFFITHLNYDGSVPEYKITFDEPIRVHPFYIQFVLLSTTKLKTVYSSNMFKYFTGQVGEDMIRALPYTRLLLYKAVNYNLNYKKIYIQLQTQLPITINDFTWKIIDTNGYRERVLETNIDPLFSVNSVYSMDGNVTDKIWVTLLAETGVDAHYMIMVDDHIFFYGFHISEDGIFKGFNQKSINTARKTKNRQHSFSINYEETNRGNTMSYDIYLKTETENIFLSHGLRGQPITVTHDKITDKSLFVLKSEGYEDGPYCDFYKIFS